MASSRMVIPRKLDQLRVVETRRKGQVGMTVKVFTDGIAGLRPILFRSDIYRGWWFCWGRLTVLVRTE
jgi:hypothetical protein